MLAVDRYDFMSEATKDKAYCNKAQDIGFKRLI